MAHLDQQKREIQARIDSLEAEKKVQRESRIIQEQKFHSFKKDNLCSLKALKSSSDVGRIGQRLKLTEGEVRAQNEACERLAEAWKAEEAMSSNLIGLRRKWLSNRAEVATRERSRSREASRDAAKDAVCHLSLTGREEDVLSSPSETVPVMALSPPVPSVASGSAPVPSLVESAAPFASGSAPVPRREQSASRSKSAHWRWTPRMRPHARSVATASLPRKPEEEGQDHKRDQGAATVPEPPLALGTGQEVVAQPAGSDSIEEVLVVSDV